MGSKKIVGSGLASGTTGQTDVLVNADW